MLELANGITDEARSYDPSDREMFGPADPPAGGVWTDLFGNWVRRFMQHDRWSSKVQNYVLEKPESMHPRWLEMRNLRVLARAIACQNAQHVRKRSGREDAKYGIELDADALNCLARIVYDPDNDKADLKFYGIAKNLFPGPGIRRIRQCAYARCGQFFWAGRLDQKCCRPQHARAFRAQQVRDRGRGRSVPIEDIHEYEPEEVEILKVTAEGTERPVSITVTPIKRKRRNTNNALRNT